FQIVNDSTIIGGVNLTAFALFSEASLDSPEDFTRIVPDLGELSVVADVAADLLDRIELMFFAGRMDSATRGILEEYARDTYEATQDANLTVQVVLYAALLTPAYAVIGEGQ
ncbi:MAG: hypothetical protein AAF513_09440, partial [Pseudomonadota bacterium]